MFVDRVFRVPRVWSNKELRKIAFHCSGDVVNVSGWEDRDKEGGRYRDYFVNAKSYYITNFTGWRGLQGCANEIFLDLSVNLPEWFYRRFDTVFSHTTLEHILDVRKALANLCEMSKDAVIVVVPFCQAVHESESYGDYWRFTPSCLRKLFLENGFEVVYESETGRPNAGVYLFALATRNPERWVVKVPRSPGAQNAGAWIGKRSAGRFLRAALRCGRPRTTRWPAAGV